MLLWTSLAIERLNLDFDHKELDGIPIQVVGEMSKLLQHIYLYLPFLFFGLQ